MTFITKLALAGALCVAGSLAAAEGSETRAKCFAGKMAAGASAEALQAQNQKRAKACGKKPKKRMVKACKGELKTSAACIERRKAAGKRVKPPKGKKKTAPDET